MNLLGNSLKFTSVRSFMLISKILIDFLEQTGFVHVSLRELPPAKDASQEAPSIRVELAVHDSGKGISQHFLKVNISVTS